MAQDIGQLSGLLIPDVVIGPYPFLAVFGDDAHQTAVCWLRANALQIRRKEGPHRRGQKHTELFANPLMWLIAQQACGRRVDKEQYAIQVMHADKSQAVFDDMTIPDRICGPSLGTDRGWSPRRFESRAALTQSGKFFDELLFGPRCIAHTALSALIPSRLRSSPRRNVRQKRSR